jgi:SAM-dependent methyltransferase
MHPDDKKKIINRYLERVQRFGHGSAAIGEPPDRQSFYYHFMLSVDGFNREDSILDVGCGYGDLQRFLEQSGWAGRYCGVDINSELLAEGKRRYPDADLRLHDIQESNVGEMFDWCFSCHVLTSDTEQVYYLDYLKEMLESMWAHCRKGVVFNLLSPLADFTNPIHNRPQFSDVLAIITRLTNRFTLRHDYMPFEFTLQLYKQNQINREKLIFLEHDILFKNISDAMQHRNRKAIAPKL